MSTPPVDPTVARGGDAHPPGPRPDSTDDVARRPPSRSADPGQGSRGGFRGDDTAAQPQPKGRDDDALAAALRERLREVAGVDVSGVRIAVRDGRVALDGRVADPAARSAVEARVAEVLGVTGVDNRLDVAGA